MAELAATWKCDKNYADIPGAYCFLTIAIETHAAAYDFFHDVSRRISEVTAVMLEKSHSFFSDFQC